MRKNIFASCLFFVFAGLLFADNFGAPMPQGTPTTIENFEDGYVWVHAGEDWDRWGGSHVTVGAEQWRKWRTDGKYSMHLIFGEQHGPSQSLWYSDYPETETLDLSVFDYLVIDVYNPNDLGLVFGFCFQDLEWNWLQSDTWMWFPKGEHSLCFDIRNIDKERMKNIRRLIFIMPAETFSEGSVYIDNIRGYKN